MGTQNGILNNSGIAIEDFYIFEFFNICDFTRSKAKLSETSVTKAETSKFLPSFHSNIVKAAPRNGSFDHQHFFQPTKRQ